MLLNYLLLGSLMERPYHGYELKTSIFEKVFAEFGINDGQLYPTLKKLEQNGLVEKSIELQQGVPNRHMYTITDMGKQEFLNWLESSSDEETTFKYEFFRKDAFFIRCNFIQYLDKPTAILKINQQVITIEKSLAELNASRESMLRKGVSPIRISILEYGIKSQETRLVWLHEFLEQILKTL